MSYLAGGRNAANWYFSSNTAGFAFEHAPNVSEYLDKIENLVSNASTRPKTGISKYIIKAKDVIANNGKDIISSIIHDPKIYVSTAGNICKNVETQLNKTGKLMLH